MNLEQKQELREDFKEETNREYEQANDYNSTDPTWSYTHWLEDKLITLEEKYEVTKGNLLEAYTELSNRYETFDGGYAECIHCLQGGYKIKHEEDCIVTKADKYLEEIRQNE